MTTPEFRGWPKTPRLFRDITITEKIDGTNAAVIIEAGSVTDDLDDWCSGVLVDGNFFKVGAQSRNRIIFPGQDNAGFAQWVQDNAEALAGLLGEGYHYGEWWGLGIQRGYGIKRKVFSLFNVHRYGDAAIESDGLFHTVPVLYQGPFSEEAVDLVDLGLRAEGSQAAPGFHDPEGFVVYHSASRQVYKVLLENDHLPKGVLV